MSTVRALGDVVRNINATLGFAPVESLVLVLVSGNRLDCVFRMDLRDAAAEGGAARLAEVASHQNANGVVAVVVSEEAAACAMCAEEARAVIGVVETELAQRDRQLDAAVLVDRVAAGGRWSRLDQSGVGGVLDDPASSAMAAAVVVEGRRVYGTREELERSVAVDVERAAVVAPLLNAVVVEREVQDVAASVRAVGNTIRQQANGGVPSDADVVEAGRSLVDVRVRDALIVAGGAEDAAAGEALWTLLARVLPSPYRVEALVLLAISAYLRGDGPLAGVALSAALTENPDHRLAGLVDATLQSGIPPSRLRAVLSRIAAPVA